MKIVLGADQYPEYINGAANFTVRLAKGLAHRGHDVDLLWPSVDGRASTRMDDGVRIRRLTSIALPGAPRMHVCSPWAVRREIAAVLATTRPDVVHVQSHLVLGRTLVRAARAVGLPIMATNHFMPENLIHHVPVLRRFPASAAKLAWRDLQAVFAATDLLTAPTQRAVDLLAEATTLPPALPISCGIDLDWYPARAALQPEHPTTLLFVGRLEQEKHVDELLRAFARLPRERQTTLEIVGMGSLRPLLESLCRDLGMRDRVVFHGAVSEEDLVAAYARADIFVMPGTAELQSLATLEAMASGLPVIAADAMALPHLVTDDVNGFLVPPGDVDTMAQRMSRLVTDPALARRLGRASVRRVQEHSLAATVTAIERCYQSLAGGGTLITTEDPDTAVAHVLAS